MGWRLLVSHGVNWEKYGWARRLPDLHLSGCGRGEEGESSGPSGLIDLRDPAAFVGSLAWLGRFCIVLRKTIEEGAHLPWTVPDIRHDR